MPIVVSTATQAQAKSRRVKMRSTTLRATKSARTRRQARNPPSSAQATASAHMPSNERCPRLAMRSAALTSTGSVSPVAPPAARLAMEFSSRPASAPACEAGNDASTRRSMSGAEASDHTSTAASAGNSTINAT